MGLGSPQQAREVFAQKPDNRFQFGISDFTIDRKICLDQETGGGFASIRTICSWVRRGDRLPIPIRV